MAIHFRDRQTAGKLLAYALEHYAGDPLAVVYALPRGGVVLGVEVAQLLRIPMSLVIARKIGHPFQEELAIGAVTETGEPVLTPHAQTVIDKLWLEAEIARERKEAARRRELYLGKSSILAGGKTAIVVDDGVATGLTLKAALRELAAQEPHRLIVAVPVAPPDVAHALAEEVDELIVLDPDKDYLGSVGAYYDVFDQVTDKEVIEALKESNQIYE